ncbi:MAG: HAMP domain-containing sensor histidine kinase [Candidatus Berkelbacteria bacterium]|nr:HAMP domain-containing sensor histidine kinase [Candidatus Berkelbacteria bacterium]
MKSYIKLTLWYMLIVMAISLFFSCVTYQIAFSELDRGFRQQPVVFRTTGPMAINFPTDDLIKARDDRIDEISHDLQLYLFYLNLIILILAGIASYFLAKRTLQPIEEMAELQSRFTADASHELRTPLTAIKTEIEVALRDKKLTLSEARELLGSNLEEIDKLKNLSDSLLRLARYQDKKSFAIKPDFYNLREIADLAVKNVKKAAKIREIMIENDVENKNIYGDENLLTELFTILLDNAIKYSGDGKNITVSSREHSLHIFEVLVADQGIGISPEDLTNIFNRFYRADLSRSSRNIAGHGLGLAIAKQIVEMHNATISATSEIGKGTTFCIRFKQAIKI